MKLKKNGCESEGDSLKYVYCELERINAQTLDIGERVRKLKSQGTRIDLMFEDLWKGLQKLAFLEKQVWRSPQVREAGGKPVSVLAAGGFIQSLYSRFAAIMLR